MKRFVRFVAAAALGLLFVGGAAADTLELKDARVLQGRFVGGTQAIVRFESNGNLQTYSVNDIVALTFTRNSGAVAPPAPPPAPVAQAAPQTPPQAASQAAIAPGGAVTIPAGQSILVRMIDGVDSSKNH